MKQSLDNTNRMAVLKIVGAYLFFGTLWIYLSTSFLGWIIHDPYIMSKYEVVKGTLFIVLTAILLYYLISRHVLNLINTEELLKESEEKYRLVVENTSEIIHILDWDGNFLFISPSWEYFTGFAVSAMVGKSLCPFVHSDDVPSCLDLIKNVHETGQPQKHLEFRIRHASGKWIWFIYSGVAINDAQGKPLYFMGVAMDINDRKLAEEKLKQTLENLRHAVGTTIAVMVSAVEMRDPYTAGHQIRSADLARAIAREMGLPQEKIDGIHMAGSIHDIGKLSIPAEILSKPTKLTSIEFSLIKEHSKTGYEMLKDVESPWPLAQIVYQHHERLDGTGYPRNLKGDEIIVEARILAVADVVEAMASHRPYRVSLGIEVALEEIEKNKGIIYDNAAADACLRLFREKGYQFT